VLASSFSFLLARSFVLFFRVEFHRSTLHVFAKKRTRPGWASLQDTERRPKGDRRRQRGWRRKRGTEREGERERNDNPFGGHNAEPGTVKLTRQEIRPTNRPLSLCFPLFLRLFPWPLARSLLCSFTPQRTYPWLYANRHRSLRASHKLTELYYADPLPLCPPRLSSPLCSRDALHSSIFSFFLFFLINRVASRNRVNNVL